MGLDPAAWRLLRPGRGALIVLTVDFGPRTGEAGFGRLADLLGGEASVYQTLPPVVPEPDGYLGHWVAGVGPAHSRVHAVLGFCAGVPLAVALGELLGCSRVLAFEPTVGGRAEVLAEFDDGLLGLRRHLLPCESAGFTTRARALRGGLVDVISGLSDLYREAVDKAYGRAGISPRVADAQCARFRAYLGYLVAAARCEVGASVSPAFVSAEYSGDAHEIHRFPVPRSGLLADAAVAEVVFRRLGRLDG